MVLKIGKSSALNLELKGTVGQFSVGRTASEDKSIEVKYLLTHVGLDLNKAANEDLLRELAPVREIFQTDSLNFDEIMQRDIDDARVSKDLIAYLLNDNTRDLVKLFPPIVIVALPTKAYEEKPDDFYAPTTTTTVTDTVQEQEFQLLRSGEVGGELFQFQQPIQDGKLLEHDLCSLKLNTKRIKLVIVDGQHRAMALLALFRNLKNGWTQTNRAPYKNYYEEWTPDYIRKFNIELITLPIMVCTFPALVTGYAGDYDVKRAARSIFLTLNKNARKVSESRNRLLDDNDLISTFLRQTLSKIKEKDDRSPKSLRMSNVELDQAHDRIRIESPIALTGVNHIYYLIEHILLNKNDEDIDGAKTRRGAFSRRKEMTTFLACKRLGAPDVIGLEAANSLMRDKYSTAIAEKLEIQFNDRFGKYIINTLEGFQPFEQHARASLKIDIELRGNVNPQIRPMLFDGQGIARVFLSHLEHLKEKIKAKEFGNDVTKLQEISSHLEGIRKQYDEYVEKFKAERAQLYLLDVTDKHKLRDATNAYHPKLLSFVNDVFERVFTSVAFETALIAGFFGELERANLVCATRGLPELEIDAELNHYLENLNRVFVPSSSTHLRKIVGIFLGNLEGEISDWKLIESNDTFKSVVYPGEMQPDEWPKYKYLLLEIWNPSNTVLTETLDGERKKCRVQIFNSLVNSGRKAYLQQNPKLEDALTPSEHKEIRKVAYDSFVGFLKKLGIAATYIPSLNELLDLSTKAPAGASDTSDNSDSSES